MAGRADIPLLLRSAAGAALAIASSAGARAAEQQELPAIEQAEVAKATAPWSPEQACTNAPLSWDLARDGARCATPDANFTTQHDHERGTIEVYGVRLHATTAPYTPDRLLIGGERRDFQSTDLFVSGVKASAFDDRLKVKAEFVRTQRVIKDLLADDGRANDSRLADNGTSATARFDALLADNAGFKWSFAGEYKTVSDDYSVGRSTALLRFHVMPGTRLSLSTAARLGGVRMNAALGRTSTPFGESTLRRAGIDLDGISLRLVSRDSRVRPFAGSSLQASRSHSQSVYADIDFSMLAGTLLPSLGDPPFLLPDSVSITYRTGGTTHVYAANEERTRLSSFGIDSSWETPLGETMASYWRDRRDAMTAGARSRWSETFQVDHSLRWGRWRFSADASLSRGSGDGTSAYRERNWSFGQSIAYSAPNGPEFKLHLGQDRGAMRMLDDSFHSDDRFSQITASLDLSRYLQKRLERDDLQLRLDYRKMIDRSDAEFLIDEGIIDRWLDGDRREGLLVSFGMNL